MSIPNNLMTVAEVKVDAHAATGGGRVVPVTSAFFYRRTTTVNPWSYADFESVFQAGPVAALIAAANVRWTQTDNLVRCVNDAEDPYHVFPEANVGAIATDSYEIYMAVYVLLGLAIRGRGAHGSKHFGPFSEADTTNDLLTGAGLVRWQAVATAILATLGPDLSGNTWVPCIVRRPPRSQLLINPTTVTTLDLVTATVNKRPGTMHRRRIGSVYI